MGNSAISTSDLWPQIIVRAIGLRIMVIGPVCLPGLDLVISQLSIATQDPWPQERRMEMGFPAVSVSDLLPQRTARQICNR